MQQRFGHALKLALRWLAACACGSRRSYFGTTVPHFDACAPRLVNDVAMADGEQTLTETVTLCSFPRFVLRGKRR